MHPAHPDVAAFALGVLDAEDLARFTGHLEYCPRCQDELDDWLSMRARLDEIDADDIAHVVVAEQIHREGDLLARLLTASTRRRRRLRLVRLASLGGSALLFAAVLAASFGADLVGGLTPFP